MVDNIRSLGSVRNAVWSVTEDNMSQANQVGTQQISAIFV